MSINSTHTHIYILTSSVDAAGVDLGLTPAAIMALVSGSANADCGLATALSIPAFMMSTVAKAYILFQALSLAKSALASDENELSQSDITAATVSTYFMCIFHFVTYDVHF